MSHSSELIDELGADPDPEPGATWFWSIGGTIIIVALVFLVCVIYFTNEREEFTVKVVDQPFAPAVTARAEQEAKLNGYARYSVELPDGSKATKYRIPIDRAFEILIAESVKPASQVSSTEAAAK